MPTSLLVVAGSHASITNTDFLFPLETWNWHEALGKKEKKTKPGKHKKETAVTFRILTAVTLVRFSCVSILHEAGFGTESQKIAVVAHTYKPNAKKVRQKDC